jgi:hypothetical protein
MSRGLIRSPRLTVYNENLIQKHEYYDTAKNQLKVILLIALRKLGRLDNDTTGPNGTSVASQIRYNQGLYYVSAQYEFKFPVSAIMQHLYFVIGNLFNLNVTIRKLKQEHTYATDLSNEISEEGNFDHKLFETMLKLLSFGFYKEETKFEIKYVLHPPHVEVQEIQGSCSPCFSEKGSEVNINQYLYDEFIQDKVVDKFTITSLDCSFHIHKLVILAYIKSSNTDNMIKHIFDPQYKEVSKLDLSEFSNLSVGIFIKYLYFGRGFKYNEFITCSNKHKLIIDLLKLGDYLQVEEFFNIILKSYPRSSKYYHELYSLYLDHPDNILLKEKVIYRSECEARTQFIRDRLFHINLSQEAIELDEFILSSGIHIVKMGSGSVPVTFYIPSDPSEIEFVVPNMRHLYHDAKVMKSFLINAGMKEHDDNEVQ